MSKQKPIVAIDISTTGKGGGPYTSTINLVNSSLRNDFQYRLFEYKTEIGRFVSIKRIIDIFRQLKKIKPDIVHFTGLQLSGFHIAVACRFAGIKNNVVVIRGSSTEAMNISGVKKIILYILEFFTLMITKRYYGVCKHSSKISATSFFKNKSCGYIYNLRPFKENNERVITKSEMGFNDSDVVIVTVTRVIKDKGCHILKDTIRDFAGNNYVKFVIIGDGDYLKTMKEELVLQEEKGQVKFLGFRNDVHRILPSCDVFVLPTLHENLSNALLEASEYGLPLITTHVGGNVEVVKDGVNGFLIPPNNVKALTKSLEIVIHDHDLRKVMGEKGKIILEEKFSDKTITDKIRTVYDQLISRPLKSS